MDCPGWRRVLRIDSSGSRSIAALLLQSCVRYLAAVDALLSTALLCSVSFVCISSISRTHITSTVKFTHRSQSNSKIVHRKVLHRTHVMASNAPSFATLVAFAFAILLMLSLVAIFLFIFQFPLAPFPFLSVPSKTPHLGTMKPILIPTSNSNDASEVPNLLDLDLPSHEQLQFPTLQPQT